MSKRQKTGGATLSRRRFLFLAGATIAGLIGGSCYALDAEAKALKLTRRVLRHGSGLRARILHISDLHASSYVSWEFIQKAIRLGLNENPDFVFLTGDFVSSGEYDVSRYAACLALLSRQQRCFACLGNHDGNFSLAGGKPTKADLVRAALEANGVRMLHNESEIVRFGERQVRVAGLGDLWQGNVNPERCLSRSPTLPTLLLAHNPDTKDVLAGYEWNIMFAGHTHGGQVILPLIGLRPFVPVRDRRFVEGLLPWGSKYLHIGFGVGEIGAARRPRSTSRRPNRSGTDAITFAIRFP